MRKLLICLLACLLACSLFMDRKPVFMQKEKPDKKPNDWFFMQRAFPFDQINYDAVVKAFRQAYAMKEDLYSYKDVPWEFGGPVNLGGRISAVAMHPSDASTIYIGAASGGVFKSENAGLSWMPVFDDAMSLSIGDIEIANSNPDILYVGTGESNAGGGSLAYDGFGIYRSNDAGDTWQHIGLEESGSIGRIVVHPVDPDRVYVAAMGRLFSDNPVRGVFRSLNGGLDWEKVLFKNDSTGAIDLVMHPEDPDILYAALWERVRRPNRRNYGGPSCGIYKTIDGGDTWTELTNGLPSPSASIGRIGIDISKSDPNILYAIYADNIGYFAGLFKSTDDGANWFRTNDGSLSNMYSSYGWWFGRLHIDPVDPDILYPIGFDLYKTSDGGSTYSNISQSNVHVDQHDLVAHPADNDFLVLGNDGGIYLSDDGGNSWNHLENLPVMQFYTCELDEQYPERLYGGAQDMGTNRTMTGAIDDWENIFGGDGFYVLVDPQDNDYVYVSYQYGNFFRSANGGYSFSSGMSGINASDRMNWMTPVVFDPNDPSILYYGSNRVYRSTNRAASWQAISPDLSTGPGTGNLVYGTLTTIAASAADPEYIYAGTDDGNAWVTKNGGIQWENISSGLPIRWITRVAPDHVDPDKAFLCLSGYRYDSYQPHVFMTIDAGGEWMDISGNLPEVPVNDIVVDPDLDSTLYIATDFGVYVTWDYGQIWHYLGTQLPNVPVIDLRLHSPTRKLLAATYGRSMYSFDLNMIVGTREHKGHENNISVYPNPTSGVVVIRCKIQDAESKTVRLFDLGGRLLKSWQMQGSELQVDISDLENGIYTLKIIGNASVYGVKLMKR
jgi:photosystem II stability/assembly factor-like uncharacterized protein